ncbi:unnamed protein product [Phytomonas sp. EM1]|nr:unnamed protein product [Phytomonas sp. EM1]|eukprot:CCW65028.1 unnamed protein product [Phytomonas sp. isolate EM1]
MQETNAQLSVELYNAENALQAMRADAERPLPPPPSEETHAAAGDLKRLRKQLHRQEAELAALLAELLPTKAKLLEYVAMGDRLGLPYPFPPELEGAAVVRLKAMKAPRARKGGSTRAQKRPSELTGGSPEARPPRRGKGAYIPPPVDGDHGDYVSLR